MRLTKIYSGTTLLLSVVADVRGVYPEPARVRPGQVFETREGPFVQYGPVADADQVIEVEIPMASQSELNTILQMVSGVWGDVFRIEAPREYVERAAILPGRDGVSVEIWPGDPADVKARVIMRFVRV